MATREHQGGRAIRAAEPILIVGAPRSGGLALAEGMGRIPELVALGIERAAVDPEAFLRLDGDRRSTTGAGPKDAARLIEAIERATEAVAAGARGSDDDGTSAGPVGAPRRPVVVLEGASLQVGYLARVLPDARFVLVHRDPVATLPEMVAAWEQGSGESAAVERNDPAGWQGPPWQFDLIADRDRLEGASTCAIATAQWTAITTAALDDLEGLDPSRWCIAGHDALLADARSELERICRFLAVDPGGDLTVPAAVVTQILASKPPVASTAELARLLPATADAAERAADLIPSPAPAGSPDRPSDPERDSPLRSVHTSEFAELLDGAGSTLVVSTYHAGSLICLRPEGSRVNTHFRGLPRPMGMAVAPGRLTVGTHSGVIDYRDLPEAAPRLEPEGTHDALYLPRHTHLTGDIRIHDLAHAGGETWVVATRFSCLATLDDRHSFVPRWRPSFISELAAEDRCHLNGLCVVDDEVRWVTALGRSDEAGGWRDRKADGGLLIDVPSGDIVLGDLSMPHSPRWHDGRLWLLESGRGEICVVDPLRGERKTVAELPGFTRGLTFVGPYALVGLSKIRETATFGGLPLTERLQERLCGAWMVDTRDGEIAGFLRFEDLVQEIYDLALLEGARRPEIAEADSSAVELSFDLPRDGSAIVAS